MSFNITNHQRVTERGSYNYPTRDGRPFDSDIHRNAIFKTIETLKAYFAGQHAYVTGNLLTFYRQGDPRRFVSPDVMVVKGVPPGLRLNYLIWEEGCAPQVVIEVTSRATRREDLKEKFEIYRIAIRVREYFLFDPREEYLSPALQGYRLMGDQYSSIEPMAGRLPSVELGLHLQARDSQLHFFDVSDKEICLGW